MGVGHQQAQRHCHRFRNDGTVFFSLRHIQYCQKEWKGAYFCNNVFHGPRLCGLNMKGHFFWNSLKGKE